MTFAEAIPKEEFNTLKSNFAELEKKYDVLSLEKTQLEEEVQQKSQDLESSDRNHEELEGKITTLQSDLDELAKDSETLNKELLGKPFSLPFRCDTCHPIELITYKFYALADPLGFPLFDANRSVDETFKLSSAVAQGLI